MTLQQSLKQLSDLAFDVARLAAKEGHPRQEDAREISYRASALYEGRAYEGDKK